MRKGHFSLITAVWLVLTFLMVGLSLFADYKRLQTTLSNDAHYVYSSVYEKAYINEVLLQNFTVLVSSRPNDIGAISSFANDMRKRYPHIERLQIQQQKTAPQSSYGSTTDYNVSPDQPLSNALFPITFVEPLNADTRYLLNDDLMADPVFTETISFARRYHQPVASQPFGLDNGQSGYALFLAFFDRNTKPDEQNLYIASLVINIASLLPGSSFLNPGASIRLMDEQGTMLDQRLSPDQTSMETGILPLLTEERTINRFGQSFRLQIVQQVQWRNLNLGLLLILFLFSGALFVLLKAFLRHKILAAREQNSIYEKLNNERQQLEQRIHERTRELHDQLMENRRLTHQVLAVQEKERRNLSRELHDELGQSLTAIRTDAKILKRIHPEENSIVNQTADSIDAIAQHIYDVTYGMMRTLRPSALDDLGLMDAIQECIIANRFDEHGISLHTDYQGALNEMSEDYNITLYRLTQEAFSNIIKYAGASNVWLDIHRISQGERREIQGDRLEVTISDDGKGFDIDAIAYKKGFGLIGMRERVRALGGVFQISRNHDQGTRIVVIIPIHQGFSAVAANMARPAPIVLAGPSHSDADRPAASVPVSAPPVR